MLIILSPAKMMDMSPAPAGLPVTDPEFRKDVYKRQTHNCLAIIK